MTTTRAIFRSALTAAVLTVGAFAVPASAGTSTIIPVTAAGFVQSDSGSAVHTVKFKKKVFRRGAGAHRYGNRHRAHRYGRFGHRQHGVAGVGHGRGLTGGSGFGQGHGPYRSNGHSGHVIKKGLFPFGIIIGR